MAAHHAFAFGQFFGTFDRRQAVDGFQLADVRPAVASRDVPRHSHEDAHFVFVVDGTYVTAAHGAPALCEAPTLVFNPAGTTHRDRFTSPHGRFFTVSISAASLTTTLDQYRLLDRPSVLAHASAGAIAGRLVAECARWDASAPLVAEGLCWELLASAQPHDRPQRVAPRWLWTARDLLRDLAGEEVTLSMVAATVGVHPIHLTRTFRRFFNCTPGEYLRRCRLERAGSLLRDAPLSLADVAVACGFADQSHFTRTFRGAFGVSPGAYRLRWRRRAGPPM
jgi:AraC family transcriptional regulator